MAIPDRFDTVAVVGNGLIGHGMAQIFAMAGKSVILIGRREESLASALEKIGLSIDLFIQNGLATATEKENALRKIRTTINIEDASEAQLVLEAVPADPNIQDKIYSALDYICPPPIVFGSGSGQPVSDLMTNVKHRGRMVATHFWFPPQLIPCVEVCAGPETDPDVVSWVVEVLKAAGKEPAVVEKEIPGFIGNRLQYALLREAWTMWASGVASAEAIDSVVRNTIGRRLSVTGPIESADIGGLDTLHAFGVYLIPHLDVSHKPSEEVTKLVEKGHRGLPSGHGVYDWSKRDGMKLLAERTAELFRHLKKDRKQS